MRGLEFVVGSHPYPWGFSSDVPVSTPQQKPTFGHCSSTGNSGLNSHSVDFHKFPFMFISLFHLNNSLLV